jgi:hypothetical protein
MKQLFLIILIVITVKASAQDGQLYQSKYLPGRTYKASNHIEIKANATISGDQQVIDQLKAKDITTPLNADLVSDIQGTVITDSSISDKYFNCFVGYRIPNISISVNDRQIPPPAGLVNGPNEDMGLTGKMYKNGREFKIDSTRAFGKDTSKLKIGEYFFNPAFKILNFPVTYIKIGDSFIQNMDINVPMDNSGDVKIQVPVTYKLISVIDGKASFDATGTVDIKFNTGKNVIDVNGTGTGHMIYDINEYFPLAKDMKFDLKLKLTFGDVVANGTAIMTTVYKGSVN